MKSFNFVDRTDVKETLLHRRTTMVKQDYLMRLIHEMVRTIMKLIFNIDEKTVDIEQELKETSDLYGRLLKLADAGKMKRKICCMSS